MPFRLLVAAVLLTPLVVASGSVAVGADSLGEKVVTFCEKHEGEKVGSGQCASLASNALRSAGAKVHKADDPGKGDYVWGKLVATFNGGEKESSVTGKPKAIEPGDILQFRDAKFHSKRAHGSSSASAKHHTAVVAEAKDGGHMLTVYHQNLGGKQIVSKTSLNMDDLKEGWVRVYEPERNSSKKSKHSKK